MLPHRGRDAGCPLQGRLPVSPEDTPGPPGPRRAGLGVPVGSWGLPATRRLLTCALRRPPLRFQRSREASGSATLAPVP